MRVRITGRNEVGNQHGGMFRLQEAIYLRRPFAQRVDLLVSGATGANACAINVGNNAHNIVKCSATRLLLSGMFTNFIAFVASLNPTNSL